MLPDMSVLIGQKLVEKAKIHKFKCDSLSNFQTMCTWVTESEILNTFTVMRLSSHSTAAALATNVFPVPGGPYSKIPVRNRMGQLANNFGYCKKTSSEDFSLGFAFSTVWEEDGWIHKKGGSAQPLRLNV